MKKSNKTALDFVVDKLTNSIQNTISGDIFPTEVSRLTKTDLKQVTKKIGWAFNWKTELDDNTFDDIVSNGTGMYSVKKTGFLEWLKAECVRVNYFDADTTELTRKIIPREILIKRIANTLGGSHPEGNESSSNQFDNSVKNLNAKSIAERPLTYYILIKSAYDILVNFGIIKHKTIYDGDFNRKEWPK